MSDLILEAWSSRWGFPKDEIRSFCQWLAREMAEHQRTMQLAKISKAASDPCQDALELLLMKLRRCEEEAMSLEITKDDPLALVRMRTEVDRLKMIRGKILGMGSVDEEE